MGLADNQEVRLIDMEVERGGDKVTLRHAQRVDPILESNRILRTYSDEMWREGDKDWKLYARIPILDYIRFEDEWRKNHPGYVGPPPAEALKHWLKRSDNERFRTTTKRF